MKNIELLFYSAFLALGAIYSPFIASILCGIISLFIFILYILVSHQDITSDLFDEFIGDWGNNTEEYNNTMLEWYVSNN